MKKETNETYLVPFSNFLNESENIKKVSLFGCDVKIYCLGKEIKIHCESEGDVDVLQRILNDDFEFVQTSDEPEENLIIVIYLLPGDILDLFLTKYDRLKSL